ALGEPLRHTTSVQRQIGNAGSLHRSDFIPDGPSDAANPTEGHMASNRISPEEANARVLAGEPIVFIDSRNTKAWAASDRKIPGAVRMTADDIRSPMNEIDHSATVIAYCT